jgi:4-amino-4-deoxy-L-arabinose transferase-like glycosyltransferase
MRLLSALLAAAAFILTFLQPAFRDAEGFLRGSFVVPMAIAFALALFAVLGDRPERRRFALWLGLACLGQAVTLQLVRAGRSIGYQHYVEWPALILRQNLPWTAFLALQLLIVTAAFIRRRHTLSAKFNVRLSAGPILLVALVLVFTSVSLSREIPRYAGELVLASLIQLVHLGTLGLAVLNAPPDWLAGFSRRFDAWLGPTTDTGLARPGLDRFAVLAACWAIVLTAVLCIVAYQRHPHVPDEVVYLIHAKYFARGWLEMPLPAVREAFDLDLMMYEPTRWYSPVPPGWPAVLALGVRLGAPWLVNPLLSGLSVVLAYISLRAIYGIRTARIATIFLCTSPWFLFLGMSFMSHQLTLAAALAGAVAVTRIRSGASALWAIPAGIAIGVVAIIRPLEGFIAAVLLGFWALGSQRRIGFRVATVGLMAVMSIATAALTLPYNRYFTGRWTSFPIMAYTDAAYGPGSNALGFGANRGLPFGGLDPFPGHGFRDVLVNTNLNLFQLNAELLGWGTGSILLLAVLLVSRTLRRQDAWMLITILAVIIAHAFYWFSGGPDFGARYWYLILVPCIALCARGLAYISERFANTADAARPYAMAFALCAISVLVFTPWRAADKYFHYRTMRPDVRQLASSHEFGRSLVLIRGRRMPDYMSAAPYNPVDLQGDAPVYAWDASADVRRRVVERYRDRSVWIVDGPTRTGEGFRVVAGPLTAYQALQENQREH